MANTNRTIKDIHNIPFFIGYMKRRLQYDKYTCRKGISKKLSGLMSQYQTHFKINPIDDFLKFQSTLDNKNSSELPITGFVYFIGTLEHEMVKIGFSANVNRRLKELQAGSPVKLAVIHKVKGNVTYERELHNQFKECRKHGEWFSLEGKLKDFLVNKGVGI